MDYMMKEFLPLAGMFLTLAAILGAFCKWLIDKSEKRDLEKEALVTKRLDDHKNEFEKIHGRISRHEDELCETREQMLEHYVKHSDVKEEFNNVYQKLGGISSALNQLIGLVKGKLND